MSDNNYKNVKVKDFFKRSVMINEIEEALNLKPDALIGIDQISSDKLVENGINNIGELAKVPEDALPDIKEIPQKILSKWVNSRANEDS